MLQSRKQERGKGGSNIKYLDLSRRETFREIIKTIDAAASANGFQTEEKKEIEICRKEGKWGGEDEEKRIEI